MRVGTGSLLFEAIEGWGELPRGWSYGGVAAGVAVDSQDQVYVFNRGEHPVVVFDSEGRFLGSWGEGKFTRPHAICIAPDETIYCIDDNGQAIHRFRDNGTLLESLTVAEPSDTGYKPGYPHSVIRSGPPFCYPTDLVIAPNGDIFVSDGYGNARIHRYDSGHRLLRSWGDPGSEPGQFVIPHGLCVDGDGRVYVADRQNQRIQIFDREGQLITIWDDIRCPNKMVIDKEGIMYVAELGLVVTGDIDALRYSPEGPYARITARDKNGRILAQWGAQEPTGKGLYFAPHGIAIDSQKNLYVGEVAASYSRGEAAADKTVLNKYVRL